MLLFIAIPLVSILWLCLAFYAIMQWESRTTLTLLLRMSWQHESPGLVAQLVTCITADPLGVASLIPARSHTFMEIDYEIISSAIFSSLPLIQGGLLSVTSKSMFTKYWLNAYSSLPRKKVWLSELTALSLWHDHSCWLRHKASNQTNKQTKQHEMKINCSK